MRRQLLAALAGGTVFVAFSALAQTASVDPVAEARSALQAADDGDRAVAEAQVALDKARARYRAARTAAEAALAALGQPVPPRPDMPASMDTPTTVATAPGKPGTGVGMTGLPPLPGADEPSGSDRAKAFGDGIAASVANGPNGSPLKASGSPDLQLIASDKDKVGSIAFTFNLKNRYNGRLLTSDQLTATATGKLDDKGNGDIAGLDGFSNGAGFKFSYVHYQTTLILDGTGINSDPVRNAEAECRRELGPDTDKCDATQYQDGGVGKFVQKYNRTGVRALRQLVLSGPIWFYGLSFDGNQATYKYLDRTAFAVKKADHFGYGGTLFGGLIASRGLTSLTGSFDYRRKYKEGDSINLCQPLSGTLQTQCLTGAEGAPQRQTSAIAALELRQAFSFSDGAPQLAIAPKFSTDLNSKAWSIEMPVYFVGDGMGKLRGGVKGIYKSEIDKKGDRAGDFAVGLFVGVPFSVFRQ